jgi:hypothetical protein
MPLKQYIETRRTPEFEPVSDGVVALGRRATTKVVNLGEGLNERILTNGHTDSNYEQVGVVDPSTWSSAERYSFIDDATSMYEAIGASTPMEDAVYDFALIARTTRSISTNEARHARGSGVDRRDFRRGEEGDVQYAQAVKDRNQALRIIANADRLRANLVEEMAIVSIEHASASHIRGESDPEAHELAVQACKESADLLEKTGKELTEVDKRAFSSEGRKELSREGVNMQMRAFDMRFSQLFLEEQQASDRQGYTEKFKQLLRVQTELLLELTHTEGVTAGDTFEYFVLLNERLTLLKTGMHTIAQTRLATLREDRPADKLAINDELRHAHDIITTIYGQNGAHKQRYQAKAMTREEWIQKEAEHGHFSPGYNKAIHMTFAENGATPTMTNLTHSIREFWASIHGSTSSGSHRYSRAKPVIRSRGALHDKA